MIPGRCTVRPLSFSQIELYRQCPLCYRLQYIDGLKTKAKWYFSFGRTMHSCAEHFYRQSLASPIALENLLAFYEENWASEGYENSEQELEYRAYGRDILTRFWELHSADFRRPVALERGFTIDIDGIKLRGFIDRVDKLPDGSLAVIDYKTNRELFTAEYVAQNLQLTFYQLAAEELWQLPVTELTLYHLRSNIPVKSGPRSEAEKDSARQVVRDTAAKIIAGEFPATEHPYCPCDFPEHCPYYKHQYQVPESTEQPLLPGLEIGGTVERYAALQQQATEIKLAINDLKERIIEYCRLHEYSRVFGSEHAVTLRELSRSGYTEEVVRPVLEKAGLWPQVLAFDPARLKIILEDDTVPPEMREELRSLKEVISQYPQLYVKRLDNEDDKDNI
ncbi:RecB family exonuclease [Chloroflexota bacterium]